MKTISYVLAAVLGLGLLFAIRVAVRNYLGERDDFQRHPPTDLALHPERSGIPGLRDVAFQAPGGERIAAWYAPSRNRAAVVLVHGTGADRSALVIEARLLAQAGFGVLALDLPGQGASEGRSQWGGPERAAIGAAAAWLGLQADIDPDRVGALGMSMGAYVLTQAAAQDARIKAVVLASSPNDVKEQSWRFSRRWGLLSQLPCYWALRASGMPLDMRPKDIAGAIAPRPVLIIGGALDELVPEYMARQIFAAAGQPKELWIVPGAHHVDFFQVAPDDYRRHLVDFFTRSLVDPAPRPAAVR